MLTRSILITGSNRGIGLELVRQFAQHPEAPEFIFAACRNPHTATELNDLAKTHPNVVVMEMDVTKYDTFDVAKQLVQEKVGERGLNVLFHNAGLLPRDRSIEDVDPENMRRAYEVNAIAPGMLAKAFLPLLRQASAQVRRFDEWFTFRLESGKFWL